MKALVLIALAAALWLGGGSVPADHRNGWDLAPFYLGGRSPLARILPGGDLPSVQRTPAEEIAALVAAEGGTVRGLWMPAYVYAQGGDLTAALEDLSGAGADLVVRGTAPTLTSSGIVLAGATALDTGLLGSAAWSDAENIVVIGADAEAGVSRIFGRRGFSTDAMVVALANWTDGGKNWTIEGVSAIAPGAADAGEHAIGLRGFQPFLDALDFGAAISAVPTAPGSPPAPMAIGAQAQSNTVDPYTTYLTGHIRAAVMIEGAITETTLAAVQEQMERLQ